MEDFLSRFADLDQSDSPPDLRLDRDPLSGAACPSCDQICEDRSRSGSRGRSVQLGNITVPPRNPENAPLMDPCTVDQLRALDKGVLLARTLKSFLIEINMMRESLGKSLSKGDMVSLGRLAHNYAGLCDFLGARALANALRDIEVLTFRTGPQDWSDPFRNLAQVIHDTRNIVIFLGQDSCNTR